MFCYASQLIVSPCLFNVPNLSDFSIIKYLHIFLTWETTSCLFDHSLFLISLSQAPCLQWHLLHISLTWWALPTVKTVHRVAGLKRDLLCTCSNHGITVPILEGFLSNFLLLQEKMDQRLSVQIRFPWRCSLCALIQEARHIWTIKHSWIHQHKIWESLIFRLFSRKTV